MSLSDSLVLVEDGGTIEAPPGGSVRAVDQGSTFDVSLRLIGPDTGTEGLAVQSTENPEVTP